MDDSDEEQLMIGQRHLAVAAAVWGVWAGTAIAQIPPASDPSVPPADQIHLLPDVANQRPRLFVSAGDIDALRAKALAPGNPFYQQLTSYLFGAPTNTNWKSDATEAQRQGYWRLPSVAIHYAITGSTTSRDRAKAYLAHFAAQAQWETGTEDDSGMGAGNIMLGAAIAYDILYPVLTTTERNTYRTKLLDQARKMYYLGHLENNADTHYWQQDPQNNHRWHRDAGLALAVLTVADPNDPNDDWILKKTKEELDFLYQWLPKDGSNHEGPQYQAFGTDHLALAFAAADRTLGTNYLQHDFFKNAVRFRMATLTPGLRQVFAYADSSTGAMGDTNNWLLLAASANGQKDEYAAVMKFYETRPANLNFGWMSVLWEDPVLANAGGSIDNLPKKELFDDIGIATMRDGWEENDVALFFKSGPYGGKTLNEYRNSNNFQYINIAHDDPDANSFQIYARGQILARPDGYSNKKLTSSHNTILVNGAGQKGEGGQWTQPLSGANRDMSNMARITWFDDRPADKVTIVEGEAAGAYNGLSRYRRTMAYAEDKYILVLDDIRATSVTSLTWLVQSEDVSVVNAAEKRFKLEVDGVSMEFLLKGNVNYTHTIGTSTADHRGTSLGLEQFKATASTNTWRTVAVFDAWGLGGLDVEFIPVSTYVTEIRVTGEGIDDLWLWDSTGGSTVLQLVSSVPEPSVVGVAALFATLAMVRRRR